jgi:endonuclease/exonuclease/phosphatase family metal-dependent hydrolase
MVVGMKSALRAVVVGAVLVSLAQAREITVLTYNVENLFDADKVAIFDDYAETGERDAYSPAKMLQKMRNIAKVLKTFNGGAGPEIVCFNEIEMDFTPDTKVEDYAVFLEKYKDTTAEKMLTSGLNDEIRGLPSEALLLKHLADQGMKGYNVAIGADEPDFAALASTDRGVHKKGQKNVLFSRLRITDVKSHATPDARDVLEVTLDVDGHPLIAFVNHWKSGASNLESEQSRRFNAKTVRDRLDAIFAENPSADVIVTGDFNSQYNQSQVYPHMGKTGINDVLGSQGDETATAAATNLSLYNLWYELPPEKRASDHHNGKWGTLMQSIITPGLYDQNGLQYVDGSFTVVALSGVNSVTELNLPKRWSNIGAGAGFSDHFPVAFRIRTVEDGDKSARLTLANPGQPDAQGEQRSVGFDRLKADRLPQFGSMNASEIEEDMGKLFRVKGEISSRRPLSIEVGNKEYGLWASDKESDALRPLRKLDVGADVEIVGLLSAHKGKPQFLVEDRSWILKYDAKDED